MHVLVAKIFQALSQSHWAQLIRRIPCAIAKRRLSTGLEQQEIIHLQDKVSAIGKADSSSGQIFHSHFLLPL